MTIDALRGRSNRVSDRKIRDRLPISEADRDIFPCPACARPLSKGTPRCPECMTRLVGGIRMTRVAGLVGVGIVVGAVLGGGATVALTVAGPLRLAAPAIDPVAAPSVAPAADVAPPAALPAVDPLIPAAALSALNQSVVLNQRLLADADRLTVALETSPTSSVEIARALRMLAADAAFGDRIAPRVADWEIGAPLSARMTAFYAAIGATARDGLAWSLADASAYVSAGRSMLIVMTGLVDLDTASRSLAAAADVTLPELTPAH